MTEICLHFFWFSPEILRMLDIFLENNGKFGEKWNILKKNGTCWEKSVYFLRKMMVASYLPFTVVFPLSFALDLLRKNGTFWEKTGYYGIFEKNPGIFENPRAFEKTYGSNQNSGRALVENPADLVPLFARLSKRDNFWTNSVSNLDGILLAHTSVTGQQNISIQIKFKVIVSQVSVVISQVAHRKCWKREFASGTWSSGKWQVVPSRKFTYHKFSHMVEKNMSLQETFSLWLLGNAKYLPI